MAAGYCLEPFLFGSEEAVLEDWLNQDRIVFKEFGFDIHGVADSGKKHKFTHFYGALKRTYPQWKPTTDRTRATMSTMGNTD